MGFYDVEADLYDLFYFDFDDDIKVYRRYSEKCDSVLEFMCGTGRILHHLAHRNMWGIDSNEKMLERAKENLKNLNTHLVKGDVREINLGREFCLIIIGLNSLTMFPKEERLKILKNAYRHLERNGHVIVDVFNPFEMVEGIMHHGDTIFQDSTVYSRFFVPIRYGDHWKMLYFYDITHKDRMERRVAELHIYEITKEELEREMREAGFEIEAIYGDYDMHDFEEDSEKIIAVGVKHGGN